jgi:hypothetical protein
MFSSEKLQIDDKLAMTLEAGNKAGFLLGFRGYDRINYQSIKPKFITDISIPIST